MTAYTYISIFTAFLVSYFIRVLPLTLIRKPIKNRFIKSFLYYVPYITLAVMTFPAIVEATQSPIAGVIALVVGIVLSFLGAGLFPVACACCAVVFVAEFFLFPQALSGNQSRCTRSATARTDTCHPAACSRNGVP